MALEKISFLDHRKGINVTAYTDAYSYDLSNQIALLSICGHDSAVKAISSAVVTSSYVSLDDETEITCAAYHKYRILSSKLESSLLHQLVINDLLLNTDPSGEILMYVDRNIDLYKTFFLKIKQRFAIPILEKWSRWLYERLCQESMIEEFTGSVKIIQIRAEESDLENIITDGMKQKDISF